jgi:hypothetical protein
MKQKKKKAVPKDVPSLVAGIFEALGAAETELHERFADEFAALHPFVPFAVEEIEIGTTVCAGLAGTLGAKVPARWRFDPASSVFTANELATLAAIAEVIRGHLLSIDVSAAWIEFDEQGRVDARELSESGFEE